MMEMMVMNVMVAVMQDGVTDDGVSRMMVQ